MLNLKCMELDRLLIAMICLAGTFFLGACEQKSVQQVDYTKILYKGIRPVNVILNNRIADEGIASLVKRVDLRYPVMVGDTLDVCVLEFKSDVYALDYYINSGRFQGIVPILRGEYLEQSIRSDARIFIFKHGSFRRYERSDLENYVRSIPGYHGGFPQEFLSLPFECREVGRTSIQTQNFLGMQSKFPVLIQSYRESGLQWSVARSWDQVGERNYSSWVAQLERVKPKGVKRNVERTYFKVGSDVNGMTMRLPGGRVVVVWGYLSWLDLERKFFVASNRIYEARF